MKYWKIVLAFASFAILLIFGDAGKHADFSAGVDRVSAADPLLTFVEARKDGLRGVDGLSYVESVTVSPDGSHLYAAGRIDNAVAVFSRNSATGALTFVEVQSDGVGGIDGLEGARWVTVSPDGKHLYAAGRDDNAVSVFSRDSTTGALTFVEFQSRESLGWEVRVVTVSPDGKHIYTVGSSSLEVFRVTIPDEDEAPTSPSVGDARVPPLVASFAGLLGIILVLGGGYLVRRRIRS